MNLVTVKDTFLEPSAFPSWRFKTILILGFFVVASWFWRISYAASDSLASSTKFYFDFESNSFLIPQSGILEIKIKYIGKIDAENFRVRPQLQEGLVAIREKGTKTWVFANVSWGDLPSVEKGIEIRFPPQVNTLAEPVELKLKIKDLKLGKEYETPGKKFWSEKAYNSYESRVNETILKWRGEARLDQENLESTSPVNSKEDTPQTEGLEVLKSKRNIALVNLSGFVLSILAGLKSKNGKIPP